MTKEEFFEKLSEIAGKDFSRTDIRELGKLYKEITENQWVSVKEALPPKLMWEDDPEYQISDKVIVLSNHGNVAVDRYDHKRGEWLITNSKLFPIEVTYWMYPPQEPSDNLK